MGTLTLCSIDDVKTLTGITGVTYDAELEMLMLRLTKQIEREIGVTLMAAASDVTEYLDVTESGTADLYVATRPITAITSVYEDPDRDYASSSLLTYDEDFIWYTDHLHRLDGAWAVGRKAVKATFRAGYSDFGSVPNDLRYAASKAAALEWQLRHNGDKRLGLTSKSYNSGNASYMDQWPDDVAEVFGRYGRGDRWFR